jgi:hypothetical protein
MATHLTTHTRRRKKYLKTWVCTTNPNRRRKAFCPDSENPLLILQLPLAIPVNHISDCISQGGNEGRVVRVRSWGISRGRDQKAKAMALSGKDELDDFCVFFGSNPRSRGGVVMIWLVRIETWLLVFRILPGISSFGIATALVCWSKTQE